MVDNLVGTEPILVSDWLELVYIQLIDLTVPTAADHMM